MKAAAWVINIAAIVLGLMSFFGLWAVITDLRASIGWWCVPVFAAIFAVWLWCWLRLARHMRGLPKVDPQHKGGPDIALLDNSVQSLALVLTLTTPFFIYLFVRGLML